MKRWTATFFLFFFFSLLMGCGSQSREEPKLDPKVEKVLKAIKEGQGAFQLVSITLNPGEKTAKFVFAVPGDTNSYLINVRDLIEEGHRLTPMIDSVYEELEISQINPFNINDSNFVKESILYVFRRGSDTAVYIRGEKQRLVPLVRDVVSRIQAMAREEFNKKPQ